MALKSKLPPCVSDVPAWAGWLAQDQSGAWWAFEAEPNEGHNFWYENEVGRSQRAGQGEPNPQWRLSLVKL